MNSLFLLPLGCLALLLLVFIFSRRRHTFTLLKQIFLPTLALFLLTLLLAIVKSRLLRALPYSTKAAYLLGLLSYFLLMVLLIRFLAFMIFDLFLFARRQFRYPKLIKEVLVFVLYIIGILLILNYYLHVRITVFLASSAVLTVVVGFAVQDILGSLFSGIVLNFEDSFRLGDWVRIGNAEGKIEQFGWRSFKIRTLDNQLVVIPNQLAAKAEVLIYGSGVTPFALKIMVGASYKDRPDQVVQTIQEVLTTVAGVLPEPAPQVLLRDFADSAVVYEIKFWLNDYSLNNRIASEIRRRIWYAFQREKIQIPFPVRDLHIQRERPAVRADEEMILALKQNEILQTLEADQFRNLTAGMECSTYGSGETIIQENQVSRYFYHILSGQVRVVKGGETLTLLGGGDFFGEISLVTGDKPNASVVAVSETRAVRISSSRFKETVRMNESMAMKLSEVITQRRTELLEFTEKSLRKDQSQMHKDTANLFARIMKYFALKG